MSKPQDKRSVSWGIRSLRLPLNGENQLLDPDIIEVKMDLRLESARTRGVVDGIVTKKGGP